MIHKKSILLLVLIFVLAISVSAVSAYDGDNATVTAADENVEILDTNIDDGSLEVENNDDDALSYPSSSSDSWIKFDEDDITINEGDSYTIHGTLYTGNSKNTAGNFPLAYNIPTNSRTQYAFLNRGEFNLDITSWNLPASSDKYKITFAPEDGPEYWIDFVENGNPEMVDSYVLIKVNANAPPQNGVVHASVTSNNAAVPNANVVLSAAGSEATYSGVADRQGVCDIQDVPYGDYTVTVTANGYEKLTSTVNVNADVTNLGLTLTKMAALDSLYLHETGVVSGAALLISVNPWATSGTLQYALPENLKNVKSAIVIVNSYSGSGNSDNYALHSDVTLTTSATTTLGSEDLYYYGSQTNDPVVYAINEHTTKQYSDYQYVYDITDTVAALNAGSSLTVNVVNSRFGSYGFDGRIKMITLFLAYDDDDNDRLTYWLEIGQSWTNAFKSEIIPSGSYEGSFDNLTLETIALSSYLAQEYTLYGEQLNDPTVILEGPYFKHIYWNSEDNYLSDYYMEGDDVEFAFGASQEGWGSYKTNILLFKAFEEEPTGDVYITVYSGTNRINNANVVLSTADGETTYSTTTDDLGYCMFEDIPYGEYTVTITANGYQDFTDTIILEDFEIFSEFELSVEGQLEYSTVHASVICNNIEHVANANVVLTSADSGATYSGTTDDEGVCDIVNVPYGEYTVTVTATGYKKLTSTATIENEETDLTLALKEDIPSTVNAMYLFDTGVVSGDAKIIAVNPWATSGSLQYALPEDVTNVKSAIVVVNSYSGSGNSNGYGLHSDVTLTTDSTITLGSEDLSYTGNQASDPTVYTINGHTTIIMCAAYYNFCLSIV